MSDASCCMDTETESYNLMPIPMEVAFFEGGGAQCTKRYNYWPIWPLNRPHNEIKLKQNSLKTVLKLFWNCFCFSLISLRGQVQVAHQRRVWVSDIAQAWGHRTWRHRSTRVTGCVSCYVSIRHTTVTSDIACRWKAKRRDSSWDISISSDVFDSSEGLSSQLSMATPAALHTADR